MKESTKKVIYSVVLFFIFVGIVSYFYQKTYRDTDVEIQEGAGEVINSVTFICSENKNIQAVFMKDKVDVVLSDGRSMSLPQAVSASGARYANSDETFVFWNKGDTAFVEEKNVMTYKDCSVKVEGKQTAIGNPASLNCEKVGGTLTIEKRGDGGEYGLCHFEENRACEEWALMQGECPLGGRKTTGYDSIDQNYCAWVGGETLAVSNSICTFKNGKTCPTKALYNGECSK